MSIDGSTGLEVGEGVICEEDSWLGVSLLGSKGDGEVPWKTPKGIEHLPGAGLGPLTTHQDMWKNLHTTNHHT